MSFRPQGAILFLASITRKHFQNPLASSGIVEEVKAVFE
jgi:hypothetical protein